LSQTFRDECASCTRRRYDPTFGYGLGFQTPIFLSIVGSTEDQAIFYLEANNWNLDSALSHYYEEPVPEGQHNDDLEDDGDDGDGDGDGDGGFFPEPAPAPTPAAGAASGGTLPRPAITTFRDLASAMTEGSDDGERETLYTGGERSGMAVQGPRKQNVVDDILKKASKSAAPSSDDEEEPSQPKYFTGSGYRLGSEEDPSVIVMPPAESSSQPERLPTVTRNLSFWRNGFSVDDGPLLRYDDPANADMLKAINQGRAPLTLLKVAHNQPVDVRVARRLDEDYQPPPKAPPKAFEGSGHRLGGISPTVVSSSSVSSASSASPAPLSHLEIDNNQPVTSVQIRMSDGSRQIAKFNHTHTIRDIRNFINASRLGESSRSYILQTAFPSRELSDEGQTIADAGILNAVVIQRYE